MPTENRSSSNHGTRTFTLDSLTAALEQVQALHEISADLIAENVFGQPAQQGQGEPVAFEIEVFGYTTLLARTHNKADATAAHYRALGHTVDIRPLGPLADHAEIAQLELEIEQLRFSLTLNDCASVEDDCVRDENRKLRTQLAEAQALLREVGDSGFMADGQIMPSHEAVELQERVEAFVSASAEPGAPVKPLILGHRLEAIDELLADADPQNDAVGVPASELRDLVSAVRSFQVRALTDGAPVEIDERAEFERRFPNLDHTLCSHEDWKDQYECPKAGNIWNGWQARAALASKGDN